MTGVTRKSLVAISLGALFLTGLSFAGKFLALGDTLAVVRLQLVLVLAFGAVLLFWAGARAVAAASLIGVVIGLGSILRSEEHTSELQSRRNLVCRLLLEKTKI